MKNYLGLLLVLLALPILALSQDTTKKVADTAAAKPTIDTAKKATPDTTVLTTPTNCYKQWYDVFRERGAKTVPDGTHEVVIAFKSGESCHCFLGKIEVFGGKIKPPLYVQQESGEYKTFASLGRKLDPEFVTDVGDQLWSIIDGMSLMFRTTTQENGRIFFYKFLNKEAQSNKVAPPPSELIKQ